VPQSRARPETPGIARKNQMATHGVKE